MGSGSSHQVRIHTKKSSESEESNDPVSCEERKQRANNRMKMFPTLVLLTAAGAQGGKIVFKEQEEKPRNNRRFGGVGIYPPSTVWGPVQFTSSPAPEIANNSLSSGENSSNQTELSALCPNAAAWCSQPSNYPEEAIMRAVQKQGESIQILFPKEQKPTKEVLRLDPSIPIDESVLGQRFGPTEDLEGSGEEGSGDAVDHGRELDDDVHEHEELHEDGFENICGLTTEYIMPRAAKNKNGQFRFIVNHPEGGDEQYIQLVRVARCAGAGEECGWGVMGPGIETRCQQEYLDHKLVALSESGEELVIDTFTFPSCCTCLMRQNMFKRR